MSCVLELAKCKYHFFPQTQLALCHYATSYSEENFSVANEFRPERWLRKDNLDRVDNFGSIPFGYGIRSCIGKRIAELEIHLALIQVRAMWQHFKKKVNWYYFVFMYAISGNPTVLKTFVLECCLMNSFCKDF